MSSFGTPHPILRYLPDAWVVGLATAGRVGRMGKAPGTSGSIIGLLLYASLFHPLPVWAQVGLAGLLAWMAIHICTEAERRLQMHDPGMIIIDEIVAQPIALIGLAPYMAQSAHPWIHPLAAFALFRLFDIAKPFGIRRLQALPGGWGVVADDLAAGIAAAAVWHGLLRYAGPW